MIHCGHICTFMVTNDDRKTNIFGNLVLVRAISWSFQKLNSLGRRTAVVGSASIIHTERVPRRY
jgi:hypothetical protein